jgi:UDP-N-acetylmuramoylalanine-D-glutamate ligase
MKRVLVWGLGVSGRSAIELLKSKGIEVYWGDDKYKVDFREFLEVVDTVVLSPGIPPKPSPLDGSTKKGDRSYRRVGVGMEVL